MYIILPAAQNSLEGRMQPVGRSLESPCLGSPCGALLFVYTLKTTGSKYWPFYGVDFI